MFIKQEDFISIYDKGKPNTFDEFISTYKVRIRNRIVTLNEYMKTKKFTHDDLKLLHTHINERNDYLERFYNTSLKIKNYIIDREPMTNNNMNNNILVNYKNVIRNLHYDNILKNTKSGIENNPTFMTVLEDLYINGIIDYKILTPSAIHYIKKGRIGSVFSSYYFRASIMNPYLVYSLNKSVLKGTRIFTPTLGWTSYSYGFLECPEVIEYVGTDVIGDVCTRTRKFVKKKYPNKLVKIFQSPSEKLLTRKKFKDMYREHFDLVFFSPPYYKLELYPGDKQSTTQYKTYSEWLQKYWEKTIILCHHVLQPKAKMCYILSGYGSKSKGESYDLLGDMNKITQKYFKLDEIQPLYNKNIHVTTHRETAEKIMIFSKI